MSIDTDRVSARYRTAALRREERQLLMTDFRRTEQEADLSEPPNCGGLGRIRHFHRRSAPGWPANPLPIDPAARALGLLPQNEMRGQVFQNAVCNWRCWYCFVPFELLAASREHSAWVTPQELVSRYLAEPDRPRVIDLTGGQPDLVPEWIPWMMEALRERGLERDTYLWSDDNLSNDYFWRHLSPSEQELVATYPMYGRVCCFKGYDKESFAFNTKADPVLFAQQFELFGRHLASGVDLYAYATFTGPVHADLADRMTRFVDQLQRLDPNLPLRTVPLLIEVYTPVEARLHAAERTALDSQWRAIEAWQRELDGRFSATERERSVADVLVGVRARR
ncbi:MAG TPA: hypothetical protein DCK98_01210 [Chloroflexi bacterium]|jgi:uncharacterized Fe-S cluster-containing radical SAM superfamily protein|nr:hypothetical protein [Chloroflexota bacterium]HAL27671.1 hypothetical protein [Chloroflexota bacterium]